MDVMDHVETEDVEDKGEVETRVGGVIEEDAEEIEIHVDNMMNTITLLGMMMVMILTEIVIKMSFY